MESKNFSRENLWAIAVYFFISAKAAVMGDF